jgi:PAS domain S-box-containing protein
MAEPVRDLSDSVEITRAEFARMPRRSRGRADTGEQPRLVEKEVAVPVPHDGALEAAREELDRERQRYQELFDFAPDAYVITDVSGVIREANMAAARLFGIPRGYLAGKPLVSFIDVDARRTFRTQLDCLCGNEQVANSTLELKLRDGAALPIAVRVAAVRERGGRCAALRWMIRDISEQRALEQRLRRAEAEIDTRVEERVRQVAEALERERAARSSAESAARAAAALAARLGTELRAPLEASRGYAEMLRPRNSSSGSAAAGGAGSEVRRAAVDSIVALHEHMLELVTDASRTASCAAAALAEGTD